MLISFCIPCMNRTYNLEDSMPHFIKAANESPPVEILILNYNSQDNLAEFIKGVSGLKKGNTLSYVKYEGEKYYHLAHAWNLAVRASVGDYIVIAGADAIFEKDYVKTLRGLINNNYTWMRARRYKGIVAIKRNVFMEIGGYDERFEVYGGEDKDLEARLIRKKEKFGLIPRNLVNVIRTPQSKKLVNYTPNISQDEAERLELKILSEDKIVANKGKPWGQFYYEKV